MGGRSKLVIHRFSYPTCNGFEPSPGFVYQADLRNARTRAAQPDPSVDDLFQSGPIFCNTVRQAVDDQGRLVSVFWHVILPFFWLTNFSIQQSIIRSSEDWYKRSKLNFKYDVHLCAYTALLRIVAKFHDTIYSDPNSPSGLDQVSFTSLFANLVY